MGFGSKGLKAKS